MKKVLCLILVLSLAILTSAAALADGMMSFDLEIVNDQPTPQKEKPSKPSTPSSDANDAPAIDIPAVVDRPNNGNSSSGSSYSSNNAGSSNNSNGGSSSNGSSSSSNTSTPTIIQDNSTLPIGELPVDNIPNVPSEVPVTIEDNQTPLGAGAPPTIDENVPQIITGPTIETDPIVAPLDGGIAEHDISDFEINGDAMHSLRIRASIAPGSVVSVGDCVELTAIPMGFMGVNFKIQWQMAEVDANGNMGAFHNIPGAFGLKYVIVFTERNINNHWRAAITIVD